MTAIKRGKASNYTHMKKEFIVVESFDTSNAIQEMFSKYNNELISGDKTQLKLIAAELETVYNRMRFITQGIY